MLKINDNDVCWCGSYWTNSGCCTNGHSYSIDTSIQPRTLVIGDIHGNFKALKECFDRCNFDYENDKLICLGDVVDGYPDVYECVEELLKVKNLILLRGNHDDWITTYFISKTAPWIWVSQGGVNTLRSYQKHCDGLVPVTHQEFFNNSLNYYIEDDMIFVHGGFNPMLNIHKQNKVTLIWDRDIIKTAQKKPIYKNDTDKIDKDVHWKKVFVGHTTTQFYGGKTEPLKFHNLWMLDTGAGWNGKLTIMDVDTEEYWQSDIGEGF